MLGHMRSDSGSHHSIEPGLRFRGKLGRGSRYLWNVFGSCARIPGCLRAFRHAHTQPASVQTGESEEGTGATKSTRARTADTTVTGGANGMSERPGLGIRTYFWRRYQ